MKLRRLAIVTSILAMAFAGLFDGHAQGVEESAVVVEPHPRPNYQPLMKRQWGVQVVNIRRVAAGYLLVFRYAVSDETKAAHLFERKLKPKLIHEETGAEFIVPAPQKTGPLRNSNMPQAGRIYWMAFANPGQFISPGDKVTIEIGDFTAKHLIVGQ